MLFLDEVQRKYFVNILTMFLSIKTDPRDCRIAPGDALTCGLDNIVINCEMQAKSMDLDMKRIFTLITIVFLGLSATAQTVENIRVDTEGEQIIIHYRIGASSERQLYNVELACSMDGGSRFRPISIDGDVGQNVPGGKSNYTITWDVFDDFEQVGGVEFIIKVTLMKEADAPKDEGFKRGTYAGIAGSTLSPFGLSAGSLKKFGFYGSARMGTNNDEVQNDIWVTITAGFTMNLLLRNQYRMHGFAGPGMTIEHYKDLTDSSSWTEPWLTFDAGIIHVISRISITTGLEYVNGYGMQLVFGVGFVF
jgi:hypothetical protein